MPHRYWKVGLSCPPTSPRAYPYNFRPPISVNVRPTISGGNQLANLASSDIGALLRAGPRHETSPRPTESANSGHARTGGSRHTVHQNRTPKAGSSRQRGPGVRRAPGAYPARALSLNSLQGHMDETYHLVGDHRDRAEAIEAAKATLQETLLMIRWRATKPGPLSRFEGALTNLNP